MSRQEQFVGGATATLAPASKTILGSNIATRGASYVRFVLVNQGANPITAVDVERAIGTLFVPDDAMNTAIAAKLPLAAAGHLDIEYTRSVGDALQVNVTSNLGTDVEWKFYIDNQSAQGGPVPS